MISEKLNQSLKIGLFILIVISSFLISPEIGYGCTVKLIKNMECTDSPFFGCGFCLAGDNSWVCGIEMTPDSYYCQYAQLAEIRNECSNADVWLKQDSCPDTNLHNGEKCIFADGSREVLDVHCHSKDGNWNGADKACVECSGKTRSKLLADTSKRCFNLTDSTWEEWPVGSTCANDFAGKCDYGCGASLECNHVDDAVRIVVPGGVCNNCVFQGPCGNGSCDVAGGECSSCPADCTVTDCCGNGFCNSAVGENSTNCLGDCPLCEPTCTCTCPAGIPCPGGECKGGLVPCGRSCDDPCTKICECAPCTLCHLFVLFKRIVDFLTLNIIFPLAVLMIVVGGVMFLTAGGDPGRIGGAKKILTATVIGLVIIFVAWLIVDTVITFLTPAGSPFQNWSTINCPICGDGNCDSGETSESCSTDCGAPVCTPTVPLCNGVCPAGCTVAQDPDCGCLGGDGCCGIGCDNATDSDCPVGCTPTTPLCDGVCPAGCTVAEDPDCGCLGGDSYSCCGIGCNNATDSDCPVGGGCPPCLCGVCPSASPCP